MSIGKYYFRLPTEHFPLSKQLLKIFSKNTLKLSYSSMPNLKAKIDGHHKKIFEKDTASKNKIMQLFQKNKIPQ